MTLIYENKVPISYRVPFIAKVKNICKKLGINPNWLMAIMDFETNGKFTASITNPLGYTGLIQFGEAAASDLGTTTTALRNMTAVAQLDYVYKYLLRFKDKLNSYTNTYLTVLFPAAIGKGDDFVISSPDISASKFRNANKSFDKSNDGKVQIWEVRKTLLGRLPSEWLKEGSFSFVVKAYKKELIIGISTVIIGIIIYRYGSESTK